MYCENCGAQLSPNSNFCQGCGAPLRQVSQQTPGYASQQSQPYVPQSASPYASQQMPRYAPRHIPPYASQQVAGHMPPNPTLYGFSSRINDPAFARYLKKSNQWTIIFAAVLSIVAIVSFYIAGEKGSDMNNPQSVLIGFAIGGMFFLISFLNVLRKSKSKTWDGTVVDKNVVKRTEHDDDSYEEYLQYTVIIKSDSGKKHKIRTRDSDVLFNYYNRGDRVRYHGGFGNYEKLDKSRDSIIQCIACSNICSISEDFCSRCKCPLLK